MTIKTPVHLPHQLPSRADWPRLLIAAPPQAVLQAGAALSEQLRVDDLQLPQSGLALLQLEDGALGDAYFLGEIPLARARVRVVAPDGSSAEGAAQIIDDRAGLARAIAVLDAVLSARLDGWESAAALLAAGAAALQGQQAARQAMLAATRVNFSLIGNEHDDTDA